MTYLRVKSESDSKIHALSTIPKWMFPAIKCPVYWEIPTCISYVWYQFAKNQNTPDNQFFPCWLKRPWGVSQCGCWMTLNITVMGKECKGSADHFCFLISGFWIHSLWLDFQVRQRDDLIHFLAWDSVSRRSHISHMNGMAWGSSDLNMW